MRRWVKLGSAALPADRASLLPVYRHFFLIFPFFFPLCRLLQGSTFPNFNFCKKKKTNKPGLKGQRWPELAAVAAWLETQGAAPALNAIQPVQHPFAF